VSPWRDTAAPIIAETIQRVGRSDLKALRKALRDAYPFGERSMHPYKVWCSEVKRQLGHPIVAPRIDHQQQDIFAEKGAGHAE